MTSRKRHSNVVACAVAVGLFAAPVLTTSLARATESPTVDKATRSAKDAAITAQVKIKILADEVTRGININVDTDMGHVLLRGTASSSTASNKAEQIAKTVDGVKSVTNGLIIGKASANPQTATARAQQAAREGADMASDAWVTTKVKSQLIADDSVKGSAIKVSTEGGIVILGGTVSSDAMRDKTVELAQGVSGVSSVNADNLKVMR